MCVTYVKGRCLSVSGKKSEMHVILILDLLDIRVQT